jgi:4-alpha-glucanotransferase
MAKEHVKLQYELGLLTESLEDEMRGADQQFDRWREVLRDRGLLQEGADDVEEQVLAMHRYIAQSPARVLCAALTDAVGEQRSQNQPGTVDEYPNWRVPLAGPDGEIISLEDVFDSPRAQRLASVMNGFTTQAWRRR